MLFKSFTFLKSKLLMERQDYIYTPNDVLIGELCL